MHAPQKIRLIKDWKNPKTGEEHSAGDIVVVPGVVLRCENAYGIVGKYTLRLAPTAAEKKAKAAATAAAKEATKKGAKKQPAPPPADDEN